MKQIEILQNNSQLEILIDNRDLPIIEDNTIVQYVGGFTFQTLPNGQIVVEDAGLIEQEI